MAPFLHIEKDSDYLLQTNAMRGEQDVPLHGYDPTKIGGKKKEETHRDTETDTKKEN